MPVQTITNNISTFTTTVNNNFIHSIREEEENPIKYSFTCKLVYNNRSAKFHTKRKGICIFQIKFIIECKQYIITKEGKKKSIINENHLINTALKLSKDLFDKKYDKNHPMEEFTFVEILKYKKLK